MQLKYRFVMSGFYRGAMITPVQYIALLYFNCNITSTKHVLKASYEIKQNEWAKVQWVYTLISVLYDLMESISNQVWAVLQALTIVLAVIGTDATGEDFQMFLVLYLL